MSSVTVSPHTTKNLAM